MSSRGSSSTGMLSRGLSSTRMSPRGIGRIRAVGLAFALAGLIAGTATATATQALALPVGGAAGSAGSSPASATAGSTTAGNTTAGRVARSTGRHASCHTPARGGVRCLSLWRRSASEPAINPQALSTATVAAPAAVAKPKEGFGPADIRSAYKLPATGAKGQTIAIVDAFDNPNVEKDLAAYRAAWKLPACTTANKCFRKVDQRGGKSYPDGDPGWGVEIALDVQAVSAACPACKILLVEADEPSFEAMGAAVNTAVRLGAKVVSNSYGADEFNGILALGKKYYTHPGVAIVASSGDFGFTAASFPAVLKTTWAVGGTSLYKTKSGGWTEDAWWGAGSGCSAWVTKPVAQKDTNCDMRTVADISVVADPDTGFAVYDTYGLDEDNGWIVVGGTSLSAPLLSGMIGLAGNAKTAATPAYAYAHRTGLKDVVGGSNGYCGGDYLCTGVKGYDAPTGLGSPLGLKAL
jgi:subtilase family serine protease